MRNDAFVAFFPTEPATLGHTILIPVAHVQDIWATDERTATVLAQATLQLAHALRKALRPAGLNIIQSSGEAATQTIDHIHVHIVPRWENDAMGTIWPVQGLQSAEIDDSVLHNIQTALEDGR